MLVDLSYRFEAAFGFLSRENLPRFIRLNSDYQFHSYDQGDVNFEDITFRYDDKELNFAASPFVVQKKSDPSAASYENVIAPPPIISFSQEKNLITTELQGNEIEVIEVWNTGVWDIRIQGILIDMKNHNRPSEQVEQLRRLFQYNNVIECSGTQFYEMGIDFLYFKSIEISGVVGFEDTIQYSINARSIKDVGFKLFES